MGLLSIKMMEQSENDFPDSGVIKKQIYEYYPQENIQTIETKQAGSK